MKKRMILINSLILFISLFVLLMISTIILMESNQDDSNQKARNYLNVACSVYDGTNPEETLETLKLIDEDIRITLISLEGSVIIDSDSDSVIESHLNRPEINNLGEIYKRHSDTLDQTMIYIASLDDGVYIRVSVPVSSINVLTTSFLGIGIGIVVLISIISILLISFFSKKTLEPINQTVVELAKLTDDSAEFRAISIDDLPRVLEIVRYAIDDKIKQVSRQKQQMIDVLNYINSGLIVINSKENIQLINSSALNIFKAKYDAVYKKNYLYLIRDIELQQYISQAISSKSSLKYNLNMENSSYLVSIKYISSSWLNDGLVIMIEDITEQIALETTKKEFFANASHELKSPLTCIIGYQQMISEGIETDVDKIIDYSKKTVKEANRMNDIVIDMLHLSKLEQRNNNMYESVNIKPLFLDIVESFIERCNTKGIKMEYQLEDIQINASREDMDHLIRNLLDNAIKYNKKDGEVFITLTRNSFKVRDTGIGISESDQKRVFERFYRVDKGKSKTLGGTGLGLAIVKHICENYGFKIDLTSQLDRGTTIEVIWNDAVINEG